MAIEIVSEHAEKALMGKLENHEAKSASRSFLLINFSRLRNPIPLENLKPVLGDIIGTQDTTIYYCHDGDVVLTWQGFHRALLMGLMSTLAMTFRNAINGLPLEQMFRYFEPFANIDELVAIMRGKVLMAEVRGKQNAGATRSMNSAPARAPIVDLGFTEEQVMALSESMTNRATRTSIEVLIIEDHAFSRKLFSGMIDKNYHCRMAENAGEGRQLYATYAPDICFIDIELGDASGHSLAKLFRSYDPGAKLVMLTAHCSPEDIEISQKNKVSAYILKPYSRSRINEVLQKLSEGRKTLASDKQMFFVG